MADAVKILLVDDNPRNLDALETILDSSGCTLIRAQNADEALFALLQNDFAAIVLDIKMPGTDGLELASLIKKRRRSQHVPIVFLTAHALDEQEVLRAYGVGGVDFLSKPINPDILRSKIAVFVDLFRTTRALASTVDALNAQVVERERAEQQLRLIKEQLEARVLERTAELARANREVRDNEERLRLALAVAQVATWEWDLATGKMLWSADPEIVFGFPSGSFGPNMRISHAIHPEDLSALDTALGQAMTTGDFQVEYRVVRPDGDVVWIADRGRMVQDATSQPTRILGVSVDLTRRKRLEEALIESDRRKDEFLATLAHELRNPLAPVRYALKVLDTKGPQTPELRWAVGIIERQTQHMSRLIDDLLDVNRITRNILELRKETVELASVISAAVEASQPLIERNDQQVLVNMFPDPIVLQADTVRLAQVFSNLLNNASKYSKAPEGGGLITLTAEQYGKIVTISVRDSGIGIAPAMLPKVFDMFTQVGRSMGQSEGGLGIGLALAKRLVEMHGGSIEARSAGLGKGSEFIVRLPAEVRQSNTEEDVALTASSSPQNGTSKRILVVDDNPDVAETFQVMLQMMGHEVETAFDGFAAIQKAEVFRPEVIVLDIGMPNMDGLETARRLRRQASTAEVTLIAITGWGGESDKRESAAAGFDIHLVKPVDPMTIVHVLDNMDSSRTRRRA
jgi:PAS domain S-box-containing protein